MFAIAMVLLFGYYSTQLYFTSLKLYEVVAATRDDNAKQDLRRLSAAVSDYYAVFKAYPPSLTDLSQTIGFESVRDLELGPTGRIRYGTVTGLVANDVPYQRAVLFYQPETAGVPFTDNPLDWLNSQNTCGADFSAAEWCGPTNSLWNRTENRTRAAEAQLQARRSLNISLFKLMARFVSEGGFPRTTDTDTSKTNAAGITLNDGDAYELRDLVFRVGTSRVGADYFACAGQFVFDTVPLDCGDLYSATSGAPVIFTYVNERNVILSVDTGVATAAGDRIRAAQELVF